MDAIDHYGLRDRELNIRARLKALERARSSSSLEPFRLVVSHAGEPLDLAKATCSRIVWPNGHLFELVSLNGNDDDLSEDDLESFIQSFPIEYRRHWGSYRQSPSHASIGRAQHEPKEQT